MHLVTLSLSLSLLGLNLINGNFHFIQHKLFPDWCMHRTRHVRVMNETINKIVGCFFLCKASTTLPHKQQREAEKNYCKKKRMRKNFLHSFFLLLSCHKWSHLKEREEKLAEIRKERLKTRHCHKRERSCVCVWRGVCRIGQLKKENDAFTT